MHLQCKKHQWLRFFFAFFHTKSSESDMDVTLFTAHLRTRHSVRTKQWHIGTASHYWPEQNATMISSCRPADFENQQTITAISPTFCLWHFSQVSQLKQLIGISHPLPGFGECPVLSPPHLSLGPSPWCLNSSTAVSLLRMSLSITGIIKLSYSLLSEYSS